MHSLSWLGSARALAASLAIASSCSSLVWARSASQRWGRSSRSRGTAKGGSATKWWESGGKS